MRVFANAALMAPAVLADDKVKLIIDTDAGFDVDDIGAIAIAHNLANQGKVDILATIHCTGFDLGIAAVNVINTYYGRPDIQLGAYKGPFGKDYGYQNKYAEDLVNNYPNGGIKSSKDVPEAQDAYVKVLEAQPDKSVTIASIGFPINIRNMLRNHRDLFEKKVKAVYYMNGMYNFGCAEGHYLGPTTDCDGAAQEVQVKFPHSVKEYFQINGGDMCTAGDFYNNKCSSSKNPVHTAYTNWMKQSKDTCWPARPSWDPVTVYAAIVGTEAAQMWEENGTDEIDARGKETWDKSWTTNNEVALWFTNNDKKPIVTKILNDMLCEGNGKDDEPTSWGQSFKDTVAAFL